ncbi:MAG: serine hydrolase domain-containing protein [Bacteroidota bacterium]
MTIRPILLIYIFIILSFFSCLNKEKSEIEAAKKAQTEKMQPSVVKWEKLSPEYIAEKRKSIERFYNKTFPGTKNQISFLVAKNGQIIYENYQGFGNPKKKISIDSVTPIHIASVSKVITATAVLKLVFSKKLKLNQKVNTILPTFPYPEVTIQHLLSHRSGMRNYAYFTADKGVWDDKHKLLKNQDILDLMANKNIKLESKTDTHFAYCNTNYAILALVIEAVTGKTYAQAMKQMIFDPLGMKHTFVYDYDRDRQTTLPSYRINGSQISFDFLDLIYGDKNIYSTPRDLLKFDMARKSPAFLTTELCEKIYVGYSNEHKGTKNYGLGIRMVNWENGKNFYFHNGWWHGYMSSYITLLDENVTIIALTNKADKRVYKTKLLAPLFGKYPFEGADDYNE